MCPVFLTTSASGAFYNMTVLSAQTIYSRVYRTQFGPATPKMGGPDSYALPDSMAFNIEPFCMRTAHEAGMSYGLSACGYDIRIGKINLGAFKRGDNERAGDKNWDPLGAQHVDLRPGQFILMSSLEHLVMPHDLVATVRDKSTLARQGIALQNTVIEPGWRGFITLEVSNHGSQTIRLAVGSPIAQLIFEKLDEPTQQPYEGKYQDQEDRPVEAIFLKRDA